MKILVNIFHPHIEKSNVNKYWLAELKKHQDITVNELYATYPDEKINITREQDLLLSHDRVVFQFPFYWYSTPSFMKKWQDEVLTYNWAYGPEGDKLKGKEFVLALSTGGPQHSYMAGGYNSYSISELLKPLQQTANLIQMPFLPFYVFHEAINPSHEALEISAKNYLEHIKNEELNPKTRLANLLKKMNDSGDSLSTNT